MVACHATIPAVKSSIILTSGYEVVGSLNWLEINLH